MLLVFLTSVLAIAPDTPNAGGFSAKNNGTPAGQPGAWAVPPNLPPGVRVKAVVDDPSGSTCINAGDLGTITCYDPEDPTLPYLIDWDVDCGFEQCQVCGTCASNGWWVGLDEISWRYCPSTLVLKESGHPQGTDILYRTRDEVFATTPLGQHYTALYYEHADRVTALLLSDPGLMDMAATLLVEDVLPALALLNDGRGLEATITSAQARRIDEFLKALSAADEGGALSRAIQLERAQVDVDSLVGLSLSAGWQAANELSQGPRSPDSSTRLP